MVATLVHDGDDDDFSVYNFIPPLLVATTQRLHYDLINQIFVAFVIIHDLLVVLSCQCYGRPLGCLLP